MKAKEKYWQRKEWRKKSPPYEVGRDNFTYNDAKSDIDGWFDANLYRPLPYDLISIMTEYKQKTGWWTGFEWWGIRLNEKDIIKYWKLTNSERDENI